MLSKEEIEKLLDCSKCKLKECIGCEITYTDRKKIREYIEQLENEKDMMQRALSMQTVGWNEGARLFAEKQKLIEKLKTDNERNRNSVIDYESMRRNTTSDFYKKSYQTTIHKLNSKIEARKEILEILKGETNVK